jgi:tetratricopeptide (TPR) repeat protein
MASLSRAIPVLFASLALTSAASAQATRADSLKTAGQIDATGKHAEARAMYQSLIATAPDAATRAAAQRRLAMSYGYDANCAKVIELEEQVIAYWATRREAEPQNAFYQQGEMANEAGRVCIDHGFINEAEKMYRRGAELANLEPAPRTHPKSLWDYRLAHAMGRVAARRGNAADAKKWVAEARRALDSDSVMAKSQEQYFPYLVGYVALFTNDLAAAEAEFTKTTKAMPNDPFQLVLLGMTHEKMGHAAVAKELYQKAYDMSTASTPPAIYSRTFTKGKLGLP